MVGRTLFFVWIVFSLLVVSSVAVKADVVNAIEIRDCYLANISGLGEIDTILDNTTTLGCGEQIYAACTVKDTTAATAVTEVRFGIDGLTYSSNTPYNGTAKNGTWARSILVLPALVSNGKIEFTNIAATNSGGTSCSASETYDGDSCFVNWTNNYARGIPTNCSCGYTTIQGNCTTSNTRLVQYVGLPGCGLADFNTTLECDYCDPGWTLEYSACMVNYTQPWTQGSPFAGNFSSVTYKITNQSCCDATLLTSDCSPPSTQPISSTQVCKLDSWTSQGRTLENTGGTHIYEATQVDLNATAIEVSGSFAVDSEQVWAYDPLVFDFDGSGITKIVVQSTDGLQMYYSNGSLARNVTFGVGLWEGQAAISGFAEGWDGDKIYQFSPEVQNGSANVFVAGIWYVNSSNKDFFKSYRMQGGVWTSVVNLDLAVFGSGRIAENMGVTCDAYYCYFLTTDGDLVQINPVTGAYSTFATNDSYGLDVGATPAIVLTGSNSATGVPGAVNTTLIAWRGSQSNGGGNYSVMQRVLSPHPTLTYSPLSPAGVTWTNHWLTPGSVWRGNCFEWSVTCQIPYASSGAVTDHILEGQTKTYTINGVDYEVTVTAFASTQVTLSVNGEPATLTKGNASSMSDILSGGFGLVVWSTGTSGATGVVQFSMTSQDPYYGAEMNTATASYMVEMYDPIATRLGADEVSLDDGIVVYAYDPRSNYVLATTYDLTSGQRKTSPVALSIGATLTSVGKPALVRLDHPLSSASVSLGLVGKLPAANTSRFIMVDPKQVIAARGTIKETVGKNSVKKVVSSDVNADASDDIMTTKGLYDVSGGLFTKLFSLPGTDDRAAVEIVDLDANTKLDMIWLNGTKMFIYISDAQGGECSVAQNLSMSGLSCSALSNGVIEIIPYGVASPNCAWTSWQSAIGQNGVTLQTNAWSSNTQSLPAQRFTVYSPGTYDITGTVREYTTGQTVSATCSVTQNTVSPLPPSSGCQISGDGGEFNYYGDPVTDHGWFSVNGAPLVTSSGWASFSSNEYIVYPLNCTREIQSVTARVNDVSSGDFEMQLLGAESSIGGLDWTIATIRYTNGTVYARTSAGDVFAGTASQNVEHNITLIFNRSSQIFKVAVDGALLGTYNQSSSPTGPVSAIGLRTHSCTGVCSMDVQVDFVRYDVSGTSIDLWNSDQQAQIAAAAKLSGCVGTERDFTTNGVGSAPYTNVAAYCLKYHQDKGESQTYCSMAELQRAVRTNTRCFAEAYAYCVNVTYPMTALQDVNAEDAGSVQQTGIDGAAACSMALGFSVSVDRVAVPVWRSLWGIVVANVSMFLIIIGALIVIMMAGKKR